MRLVLRAAAIFGLLLVIVGGVVASQPVYWLRVLSDRGGPMLLSPVEDWPQLPLKGAAEPLQDPPGDTVLIAPLLAKLAPQGESAVVLMRDGAVLARARIGASDDDPRLAGGGLTKALVALCVGVALGEGKIASLDQAVGTWIGPWADDPRGRITLKDLLQQTSGLAAEGDLASPFSARSKLRLGDRLASQLLERPLTRQPGERFEELDANTGLLVMILEQVTRQPFALYASEAIWKKLGAADALIATDTPGGLARGFCCMGARPADWARLGQLILDKGKVGDTQVVPESFVAQMTEPGVRNPTYGMHLWLSRGMFVASRFLGDHTDRHGRASEPFLAPDVMFLDGEGGRQVAIVPSLKLVIARLGDTYEDWDDALLPNAAIRAVTGLDTGATPSPPQAP